MSEPNSGVDAPLRPAGKCGPPLVSTSEEKRIDHIYKLSLNILVEQFYLRGALPVLLCCALEGAREGRSEDEGLDTRGVILPG